jgi:hypothetical protein
MDKDARWDRALYSRPITQTPITQTKRADHSALDQFN